MRLGRERRRQVVGLARRGERHPDQTTAAIAARWAIGLNRRWWRSIALLVCIEALYQAGDIAAGGSPLIGVLPGLGVAAGLWWTTFRCARPIVAVSADM
jgi:hypothetical protein